MYKVKVSKKASNDIKIIISYIALDNPDRARSFAKSLLIKARSNLSFFPLIGKSFGKHHRVLIDSGYYIVYKVDEEKKEVSLSRVINPTNYNAYRGFTNF